MTCRRTRTGAGSSSARAVVCLAVCLLVATAARAVDRPPIVAAQGDAFVAHQGGSDLWSYGTRIDEDAMIAEIDRAAALGVELFVMDAGWYVGAGETSDFDFDAGLGSWTADPDRFPSGLASVADYAHGVGMRFGLWIEPERVSLATVDKPGLVRESWLATHGNDYGSGLNAQICLSGAAGRKWVLD